MLTVILTTALSFQDIPLCLYLEDGTAVVCPIYKKQKPSELKNASPYPTQVVMETCKIPKQITI